MSTETSIIILSAILSVLGVITWIAITIHTFLSQEPQHRDEKSDR